MPSSFLEMTLLYSTSQAKSLKLQFTAGLSANDAKSWDVDRPSVPDKHLLQRGHRIQKPTKQVLVTQT